MTQPDTDGFEQAKACFLAGLTAQHAGDDAQAERCYRDSLGWLPDRVSTLTNLAATLLRLGRAVEAQQCAEAALAQGGDDVDALLQRASALAHQGQSQAALEGFGRVLERAPIHAVAWSRQGSVLREMGRAAEAAAAYRQAIAHGADEALHRYYLAAVDATATPTTAPQGYVENLFDSYANEFDAHLVQQLQYHAPERLIQGLQTLVPGPFERTLDLGCGTGLCAPGLRPLTRHLSGIDLSSRMLDVARAGGHYDLLEHGELTAFLDTTVQRFDLVVAADVLIYLGALVPLFAGVRRVMPQGLFCFTIETPPDVDDAEPGAAARASPHALPSTSPDAGFVLLPSLRFAHTANYVQQTAAAHGFRLLAAEPGAVRQEQQRDIAGRYVYLQAGG